MTLQFVQQIDCLSQELVVDGKEALKQFFGERMQERLLSHMHCFDAGLGKTLQCSAFLAGMLQSNLIK